MAEGLTALVADEIDADRTLEFIEQKSTGTVLNDSNF